MRNVFAHEASTEADSSMLIDRYLPEYDVTAVRHTMVNADPETTYEATLTTDLLDTGPIVRALGRLRDLPRVVSQRLGGAPEVPPPERMRFVDVPASEEWTKLDEAPGEEFVFGAVGKFWRPEIEWRQVDPGAFRGFDEPGYAKLAIGLSVRPYDSRRTLLSYEARTATTDERARRNFRRYWRIIGPFAGYLMSRALERIAADAEDQARRDPTPKPDNGAEDWDGGEDGQRGPHRRTSRRLATAAALVLAGAYHFVLRPWHRRWGATHWEARASLPGDDLLSDATEQITHAIEIEAPAEAVWPWLVQIGQDRGGFYSYDWIERAIGADIHNVDRIVPAYQDLQEGDVIRLAPEEYPISSSESAPEVARLDPGRALVLRPSGEPPAWTWAFVLEPIDGGTTRLLARQRSIPGRSSIGPLAGLSPLQRMVNYLLWEPAHFVMERKMLMGIKRRAEQAVQADLQSAG